MKNNFQILKKQIRFYVFFVGLLLIIIGIVFKIIYGIQYDKIYSIMSNEEKYIFIDVHGNEQIKTIHPYQVQERMSYSIVSLDGDGFLLIILGSFISLLSGIACIWTIIPNEYKATHEDLKQARIQPKIECPYCHSTNVTRISNTERVASIAMLGIFSKKINKNFKCNSCKATF